MDDVSTFQMSATDFIKELEATKGDYIINFKYSTFSSKEINVNYKKLVLDFFLGSKTQKFFNKNECHGKEYWTNDPPEMNLSLIKQKNHPIEWRPEELYKDIDIYTEAFRAIRKGDIQLPPRVPPSQPIRYQADADHLEKTRRKQYLKKKPSSA